MKYDITDQYQLSGRDAATGVGCFALGALAMYLLDPVRGNRRRAILQNKLFSGVNVAGEAVVKTAQYTRDHTRGMIAETASHFRTDHAGDEVIVERVRSALGRVVSHPRAIEVRVQNGQVELRGPILAHELNGLLATVRGVRGVQGVQSFLDVHKQAGNIPALQGGGVRPGRRTGLMEENWSPFTRLWTGLGGAALALWGVARRDSAGVVAGLFGAGLLTRSLTNLETRRLTGIGAGRRAVSVQKTISINAPIDDVFGFFSNYENFPRFMSNVREVRDHASGRSHWVVAGPLGVNIEWDADLTQWIPNECLAWRSVEGATVENAGVIKFQDNFDGSTRVDIKLSYNPPGGAMGHALATLFGADPKSEMDGDLARVKTMIETGNPPRDAARPLQESRP